MPTDGGTQMRKARWTAAIVAVLLLSGCTTLPTAQSAPPDYAVSAPATGTPAATAQPTPAPSPVPAQARPAAPDAPKVVAAEVIRVVDGDTAVFRLAGGQEEKTRFIGIDTPESTNSIEAYGKEASAYTARVLYQGRDVYLERDAEERDRYGRLLAYIWLERPASDDDAEIRARMFNARLALDGYAQQMTIQPNSKYADRFTTYVREAREAGRGLWDPALVSGAAAGGGSSESAGAGERYIGNLNSMIFHEPTCSSVDDMSEKNKQPLASREEALARGFRGCKRCNP